MGRGGGRLAICVQRIDICTTGITVVIGLGGLLAICVQRKDICTTGITIVIGLSDLLATCVQRIDIYTTENRHLHNSDGTRWPSKVSSNSEMHLSQMQSLQ